MKKIIFFVLALIIFIAIPAIAKAGPGNAPFSLKSSVDVLWELPASDGWEAYKDSEGEIRIVSEESCAWKGIEIYPEARAVIVQDNVPYYATGDCNKIIFRGLPSIIYPLEINIIVYWMGNEHESVIQIQEPNNQPPECDLSNLGGSVQVGQPVTLTVSCYDPEGDPLTYSWDFLGNGEIVIGSETMTYIYENPGEYKGVVIISDAEHKITGNINIEVF